MNCLLLRRRMESWFCNRLGGFVKGLWFLRTLPFTVTTIVAAATRRYNIGCHYNYVVSGPFGA